MKGLSGRQRRLMTRLMLCAMLVFFCVGCPHNEITVTRTEEQSSAASFLGDDSPGSKNPAFVPDLIDSRPLQMNGGTYDINLSAAVIGLDVLGVVQDDAWMNELRASYADAIKAAKAKGVTILPSVNMINGKAKQFDDGLYAAMDLAYFHGVDKSVPCLPDLMARFLGAMNGDLKAAAFFSAGLMIGGIEDGPHDAAITRKFIDAFERDETASKPIGFYTWNEELKTLFRFFRFFQQRIEDREIADAVAAALVKDEALRNDYEKLLAFYSGLTNPFIDLSCMDLIEGGKVSGKPLDKIAAAKGLPKRPIGPGVCILPYSGSTETVLFEKLFPEGLPGNANLMEELIARIRSGKVDLAPTDKSGWYTHQVYALETLLLPTKGQEAQKLCMTARYKERTLEAFKAILTKTRETHARQAAIGCSSGVEGPATPVAPRLRLEPAPSFYLRTARSYAFVEKLVTASLGADALHSLNRIRENGKSDMPLDEELRYMKNLFYGFYLVCCEDVGLKPDLAEGEVETESEAMKAATEWLEKFAEDPDLAYDTRVSVPVYNDFNSMKTTLWATLGVRLANLKATYAKPPSLRLKGGNSVWSALSSYQLGESLYVIPVDEFSEITLPRLGVLTREELREVCDREKAKEKILEALQK